MNDFVAIDFETANETRGSACEVSVVRFTGGKPVESITSLVRQDRFSLFSTSIHGISARDVREAPRFWDLWPALREFIGDRPVVAHNAGFDMAVLWRSLEGHPVGQDFEYFCTMVIGRRSLPIAYFGLPGVTEHFGIHYPMDHRAENDAIAAGLVASALMSREKAESLHELAQKFSIQAGRLSSEGPSGSRFVGRTPSMLTQAERDEILACIPESELYEDQDFLGKKIVFTGALISMERREAHVAVMKAGGLPKDAVTKETNMLIYGYQDPRFLKGRPLSSKLQKAVDLRAKGADIELVDELQFLQMLESRD